MSDECVFNRVRFGSRFEYPSDTYCANDRSGAGELCDDHEVVIRCRDELISSMRSRSWLCYITDGAHTRAKMIERRGFAYFSHILCFVCVRLGTVQKST